MTRLQRRCAALIAVSLTAGCATTGGPDLSGEAFLCAAAGALVGGAGATTASDDGGAAGFGAALGAGLGYLACREEAAPAPAPDVDTDRDGVVDRLDACPGTRPMLSVDRRGCPIDTDGDGVFDGLDRCPDTVAGARVDEYGCERDSDGDGVNDSADRCPGTPGGVSVDSDGCPLQDEVLFSFDGVNFATNDAALRPGAEAELDTAVAALKRSPSVDVRVEGHTDATGAASYNQALSERRARAVADYLVRSGIAPGRIRTVGYGEDRPIAPNDTASGRARNRRVEIVAD